MDYEKEDDTVDYINLETIIELCCHLTDMVEYKLMCKEPQHDGCTSCPIGGLFKKIEILR